MRIAKTDGIHSGQRTCASSTVRKTKVFRGMDAAEPAEVMIEVRLIGVAMVERQTGTVDSRTAAVGMDHMLEPFNLQKA